MVYWFRCILMVAKGAKRIEEITLLILSFSEVFAIIVLGLTVTPCRASKRRNHRKVEKKEGEDTRWVPYRSCSPSSNTVQAVQHGTCLRHIGHDCCHWSGQPQLPQDYLPPVQHQQDLTVERWLGAKKGMEERKTGVHRTVQWGEKWSHTVKPNTTS